MPLLVSNYPGPLVIQLPGRAVYLMPGAREQVTADEAKDPNVQRYAAREWVRVRPDGGGKK